MGLKKVFNFLNKIKWTNKNFNVLFLLILVVLFFVYDYHEVINKQPQSVHVWRQADCITQVINYAERNHNFFQPQIHCQVSEDYTSGYCVEEFPIFYYFVSILYRIFGNHDFLYRGLVLLLFYLGIFYLYKLNKILIKDNLWSIFLTLVILTAPVLVYYGNNYLLNIPGFSITLIAWYFFILFYLHKKNKHLIISIVLFTLASLLKISELISVFTIIGVSILDYFKVLKSKYQNRVFEKPIKVLFYSLFSVLVIFIWYLYSHYYNESYSQKYYLYIIKDYFSMSSDEINGILNRITDYWSMYYHNTLALYFLGLTFILNLFFIDKVNRFYMSITSIMLIGSILFGLLFFGYLGDHDYYIISLFITVVFSLITLADVLKNHYSFILNSNRTKFLFLLFLLHSIHYADLKMHRRYTDNFDNQVYKFNYTDLYTIKPYLDSIGIKPNDKVISIPDVTPNVTLCLMNLHGYTNFINWDNEFLINLGISKGAKYLIVSYPELLQNEKIKPFLYHKVGEYNRVSIYKLDGIVDNSFDKATIKEKISWDMEKLSVDGLFVISDTLNYQIKNSFISSEKVLSGNNSLIVNPLSYGIGYFESEAIEGQKYAVNLKVFTSNYSNVSLRVCASSPEEFFVSSLPYSVHDSLGWYNLNIEFRIPKGLSKHTLSIDVYNANNDKIFIDDLCLIKFNL